MGKSDSAETSVITAAIGPEIHTRPARIAVQGFERSTAMALLQLRDG